MMTELPWEMGHLLQITILDVSHNPLVVPPRDIQNKGTHAILRWLKENEKEVEHSS